MKNALAIRYYNRFLLWTHYQTRSRINCSLAWWFITLTICSPTFSTIYICLLIYLLQYTAVSELTLQNAISAEPIRINLSNAKQPIITRWKNISTIDVGIRVIWRIDQGYQISNLFIYWVKYRVKSLLDIIQNIVIVKCLRENYILPWKVSIKKDNMIVY